MRMRRRLSVRMDDLAFGGADDIAEEIDLRGSCVRTDGETGEQQLEREQGGSG